MECPAKTKGGEVHNVHECLDEMSEVGGTVDGRALGVAVTGQVNGQGSVVAFQVGVLVSPDPMVVDGAVDHQDVVPLADAGLGLCRKLIVDVFCLRPSRNP